MAAIDPLEFSKDWKRPGDFPVVVNDETVAREAIQELHDQTKNYINNILIPTVVTQDATEAARAAAERGRVQAESARADAEKDRVQAEKTRVETEQKRVEAEKARDYNEHNRINAEAQRRYDEQNRAAAEEARVSETAGVVAQATAQAVKALQAADTAAGSANTAQVSEENARLYESNAQAAEAHARASETAALDAARKASVSEGAAADYAVDADTAATLAHTSEQAAAGSAAAAAESAAAAAKNKVYLALFGRTPFKDLVQAYSKGYAIILLEPVERDANIFLVSNVAIGAGGPTQFIFERVTSDGSTEAVIYSEEFPTGASRIFSSKLQAKQMIAIVTDNGDGTLSTADQTGKTVSYEDVRSAYAREKNVVLEFNHIQYRLLRKSGGASPDFIFMAYVDGSERWLIWHVVDGTAKLEYSERPAKEIDAAGVTATVPAGLPPETEKTVQAVLDGQSEQIRELSSSKLDETWADDTHITDANGWSIKQTLDATCSPFEVTGSTVSCTPIKDYPLAVAGRIDLMQEGEGTPSPSNVRHIAAYDSIKITNYSDSGKSETIAAIDKTVCEGDFDLESGSVSTRYRYFKFDGSPDEVWEAPPNDPEFFYTQTGIFEETDAVTGLCNLSQYGVDFGVYHVAYKDQIIWVRKNLFGKKITDLSAWRSQLAKTPLEIAYKPQKAPEGVEVPITPVPAGAGENVISGNTGAITVRGVSALSTRIPVSVSHACDILTDKDKFVLHATSDGVAVFTQIYGKELSFRDAAAQIGDAAAVADGPTGDVTLTITLKANQALMYNAEKNTMRLSLSTINPLPAEILCLYRRYNEYVSGCLYDQYLSRVAAHIDSPFNSWQAKAKEFSSLMIPSGEEIDSFLFFTDPHYIGFSNYWELMYRSIDGMGQMYARTPVSYCLCGGDWLNVNDKTADAAAFMGAADGMCRKAFPAYVPVLGNHDFNGMGESLLTRNAINNLFFRQEGKAYYKYKSPGSMVYVFDSATDYAAPLTAYYKEQLDFFAASLKQDDPKHSYVAIHVAFDEGVKSPFAIAIAQMINAYNGRTAAVIGGKSYDFSGAKGTCHFIIAGHEHIDLISDIEGVPVILTTCTVIGHEESCYDLVMVDYTNHVLHTVRIGDFGSNRDIQIIPTVQ